MTDPDDPDLYQRARDLATAAGDEWCTRRGVSPGHEADADATLTKYVEQARQQTRQTDRDLHTDVTAREIDDATWLRTRFT